MCAARCSDSFLLRPQAGANRCRPIWADILKHLLWSGPFLVEQVIRRRHAVLALRELLQQRLVVAARIAGRGRFDLRTEVREHEFARRLDAAVEIDRRDQRLEHVGQHRRRHGRMRRHPFAQHQKLAQPKRLADLRARLPADDDRLELRQVAFELLGKLLEQLLADDQAEDRVAEKLQPLVRRQPMIGPGGVRQRRVQQLRIAKPIAEPLLAALQAEGIVRDRRPAWATGPWPFSISTRRVDRSRMPLANRTESTGTDARMRRADTSNDCCRSDRTVAVKLLVEPTMCQSQNGKRVERAMRMSVA